MSITIAFPIGYKPVLKHGDHDQSDHGVWATGTVSDLKSETIPTSELGRGKVRGEIISAKITVQNEDFNISQINEKYDDGVTVMNLSLKDSENRNIGRLSASNQFVSNKEYAKIGNVEVRTNYQRKGVATAMLNFARKNMIDGIEIRHDWNMLSPSGKAWADVTKHGDHDQSTHGSWATGITEDLSNWSPKEKVPDSPRNATGTTQKFWDNWEHGVDGDQFVDLYRQYAGEMLGLPVPKSDKDVGGTENYLTQRGFGASSTDAVRNQTEAVLNAIANGRPQPALYRGMAAGNEESKALLEQFTRLEKGDTIDMPLVSTTRSLGVAQWYAADRSYTPSDAKVILKIQEGAKGVSVNREKSFYPSDFETITSGKFEVVGKSEVTVPYWARGAVHARTFELSRPGEDLVTGYRFQDPKDLSWDRKDSNDPAAKVRYETIRDGANTGDFSKIETPTLKYTNDRQPNGVKDGRDITVNSWTRKEPTTFTVIEVKMVEPHVVKKGADLGMTFHNLFNDIPFIRDEEDVKKHGDHDQSSHGSWATNNFNEIYDGEKAQNTYFDTYGIKTDGSKDPVGISREEIRSLNTYTADGYAEINGYLRRFDRNPDEDDSTSAKEYRQMQEYRVGDLDKLIEEAPEFFGDKNLYRVFDKSITDTLEVGDFLTDKGFMSTTRVDITRQEGLDVLQNLQMIRTTDDTPSILLPSESKKGKGLAVDYMKNAVVDLFENVSTANNEKEVLLPRGTTLKFMGYKQIIDETPSSASVMKVAIFQRMDK